MLGHLLGHLPAMAQPDMWSTVQRWVSWQRCGEQYLKHCSEEGSGVGEASQPVANGIALVYPAPQLVQALQQVSRPGAQRLQAGVCLQPCWRHLQQQLCDSGHTFDQKTKRHCGPES